jgi:hypothetical protein
VPPTAHIFTTFHRQHTRTIDHETCAFAPFFCPSALNGRPENPIASCTISCMLNTCHSMARVGK